MSFVISLGTTEQLQEVCRFLLKQGQGREVGRGRERGRERGRGRGRERERVCVCGRERSTYTHTHTHTRTHTSRKTDSSESRLSYHFEKKYSQVEADLTSTIARDGLLLWSTDAAYASRCDGVRCCLALFMVLLCRWLSWDSRCAHLLPLDMLPGMLDRVKRSFDCCCSHGMHVGPCFAAFASRAQDALNVCVCVCVCVTTHCALCLPACLCVCLCVSLSPFLLVFF